MSCAAPTCHRATPRIAPPESDTEREATRIADEVIAGGPVSAPSAPVGPGVIHRECAACASGGPKCAGCAEEEEVLHRDATGPAPAPSATRHAASALSGGGSPMPGAMRVYFEPRFGTDLSGVRLHTGGRAAAAAQGINARAYTMGRDIAFAPGAYAPDTGKGRKLLAHEIAHTLQGDGQLHRQENEEEKKELTLPFEASFPDSSGGGSTTFKERMTAEPTHDGHHVRGHVERREVVTKPDGSEDIISQPTNSNVEFNADPKACEINLNRTFGFEVVDDSDSDFSCQGKKVSNVDADDIKTRYLAAVNAALNDQFVIRLSNCKHGCANRDIPINVHATEAGANAAESRMQIVRREGRGSAGHICAGNYSDSFAAHEGGHQILGRGDEYREHDKKVLEQVPHWGRRERIRRDNNRMGERKKFGRFGVFHKRDFRHVQTFMRYVTRESDCHVELKGAPKVVVSYRPFVTGGLGSIDGTYGFRFGSGIDVGFPLTRERDWLLLLGAQADFLKQMDDDQREFVLVGMRMGFEYSLRGKDYGARFFGGGRFGVSHELITQSSSPLEPTQTFGPRTNVFGEGEIGVGLSVPIWGDGNELNLDIRGQGGGEIAPSDEAAYWLNVGASIGARF